jgi:membrane-associated phospholipid phosphatase
MIEYDDGILGAVSKATLILAGLAIFVIGLIRRSLAVAILAVVGYGSAVVGAEVFKHTLPWHPLVPADASLPGMLHRETYPSGHTTIGVSIAVAFVLVSSARWRPWLAMLAGFVSASFATSVVFAGWHRPSDALGGILWSGFCLSLAAAWAVVLRGHPIRPLKRGAKVLIGNALLAIVVAVIAWMAAGTRTEYHGADLPFLTLTLLIITGSFSLTAWFAWELRHVDL